MEKFYKLKEFNGSQVLRSLKTKQVRVFFIYMDREYKYLEITNKQQPSILF